MTTRDVRLGILTFLSLRNGKHPKSFRWRTRSKFVCRYIVDHDTRSTIYGVLAGKAMNEKTGEQTDVYLCGTHRILAEPSHCFARRASAEKFRRQNYGAKT